MLQLMWPVILQWLMVLSLLLDILLKTFLIVVRPLYYFDGVCLVVYRIYKHDLLNFCLTKTFLFAQKLAVMNQQL